MRILAVIVTYNGMRWVDRCLGSLRASDVPVEVFVLDNGSSDGTPGYIREHFPEVHLEESGENLGFARGNNVGLRYALEQGYDFVYLLNQDAWIRPDTVRRMLDVWKAEREAGRRCGILSPLQRDAAGAYDAQFAKRVLPRISASETPAAVPFVMAAHWLISRECLEETGLFAPIFPFYGEDDNYCARARYHGFRVLVCPGAEGVHDRAGRDEPLEKIIWRNYRMASLVKLCDISRPLWLQRLFVLAYTAVKCVRYRSLLPCGHWRELHRMMPQIKETRRLSRERGAFSALV